MIIDTLQAPPAITRPSPEGELVNVLNYNLSNKFIKTKNTCSDWRTVNIPGKTVPLDVIAQHITGQATIGLCSQTYRDVFMFDLDAHNMFNEIQKTYLTALYRSLTQLYGLPHAVHLTRDGGGLHCHYYLKKKIPHDLVDIVFKAKNKSNHIELLPTPKKAARLPYATQHGGIPLDPATLAPLPNYIPGDVQSAMNHLQDVTQHRADPADLLDIGKGLFKLYTKKSNGTPYKQITGLKHAMELQNIAMIPTKTNDPIMAIMRTGFYYNWSTDYILTVINAKLADAGIVKNADTKDSKLIIRINAARKSYIAPIIERLKNTTDYTILTAAIIDDAMTKVYEIYGKLHGKTDKKLRAFIKGIYSLKTQIDKLNHREAKHLNYYYRGFFNTVKKQKMYYVPKTFMEKYHGGQTRRDYAKFLQMAIHAGLMTPGYVVTGKKSAGCYIPLKDQHGEPLPGQNTGFSGKGICRKYKINL